MMMANPRRSSHSSGQSIENPFASSQNQNQNQNNPTFLYSLKNFFKKPQAVPFLLSFFLFLTWASLRFQRSSTNFHSPPVLLHKTPPHHLHRSKEDDAKVNLVRFSSASPSLVAKDNRGWLLDPVAIALRSGISGGALNCAAVHIGEIRPGSLRGNHRHYTCNETFVIWGATTKFRLENREADDTGYAEVIVGADEVAVAASPSGTAHALVNMDPVHSTFFMGCQDCIMNHNSSSSDYNVWKDL